MGGIRGLTDRGTGRACAGRGTDSLISFTATGSTGRVTTRWLATIASGRLGSGLDDVAAGSRITR